MQYVGSLERAFETALKRAGAIDRLYRIAGRTLRVRFAGETMVPLLTPAFGHAAVDNTKDPQLSVCVLDSQATGVQLPEPPWGWERELVRGRVVVRN